MSISPISTVFLFPENFEKTKKVLKFNQPQTDHYRVNAYSGDWLAVAVFFEQKVSVDLYEKKEV